MSFLFFPSLKKVLPSRSFGGLPIIILAAGIAGRIISAEAAVGVSDSDAAPLKPVIVTAARIEQTPREVVGDVSIVSEADIRAANVQSVQDLLRVIPGVQISSNGGLGKTGSLFLRGANANQTLLLIDGVRVGSATTGAPAFQNIPVDQIERIEVLRGPASSLYGADAIGGVIQIFTKSGSGKPAPSISAGIGSNDTLLLDAAYRGAVGDTQFAFDLGYQDTRGINAIANPQNTNFNSDRDGYRNTNFSAQVSQAFNERHKAGFTALLANGRDHYDSSFPISNFDYRNNDQLAAYSLWSRNQFADAWTSNLRLGQSVDDNRNFGPVSATNLTEIETQFKTVQDQLSWQNDFRFAPGVISVGVETLRQKITSTTTYNPNDRTVDSLFAGYVTHFGATTMQLNARNDDNSQYGSKTTGYAGLSHQLAESWQIGGSTGTGFRAPTFNELYFPGFGNPALRPENSHNNEIFSRYTQGRVNGSLTLFKNLVKDLVVNTGPSFQPVNVGKANLRGATFGLNWAGEIVSLGGNIDWLSARDTSGGANDGKLLPRRARQAATLYAGIKHNAWDWRAEATSQGERFDDAANSRRLGGYGILNLITAYQAAADWTMRLRIDNVLGKRYELARDYNVSRQAALFTLTYQPQR